MYLTRIAAGDIFEIGSIQAVRLQVTNGRQNRKVETESDRVSRHHCRVFDSGGFSCNDLQLCKISFLNRGFIQPSIFYPRT